MLTVTLVSNDDELQQIHDLNKKNLKQNITKEEQEDQGFVTWLYSLDLLKQMHLQAPSVIVKHDDKVVGYALTALKESRSFHPDLDTFFNHLDDVVYLNKPLAQHHFYCMGQICIDKNYRGKGVFQMLYQKHKEVYSRSFDFLLTEISTSNFRSLNAHGKIGFVRVFTYADASDEWSVVVWHWK
jgi:GNAT superfamily N-acetyltransferase